MLHLSAAPVLVTLEGDHLMIDPGGIGKDSLGRQPAMTGQAESRM